MSDFLSNLVARSLGTLEVIRPRVPSLYEPYRRESGLLGVRPSFLAQETNPEPQDEAGWESDGNAAHINHRITSQRTQAPSPSSRDRASHNLYATPRVTKVQDSVSDVSPSSVAQTGAIGSRRRSAEMGTDLSSSRLLPGQPTIQDATRAAPPATPTVRPPVGPRSGVAKIPAAVPGSKPPEPIVQVTIGRVEVRAIFPEPPARRSQPNFRTRRSEVVYLQ
jgi:hypothetical protein